MRLIFWTEKDQFCSSVYSHAYASRGRLMHMPGFFAEDLAFFIIDRPAAYFL